MTVKSGTYSILQLYPVYEVAIEVGANKSNRYVKFSSVHSRRKVNDGVEVHLSIKKNCANV